MSPQNFRGTQDYIGTDMRWRQQVISTVQQVFESFGFEPLETPVIELLSTLTGKYGEEGEMKMFRLTGSESDPKRGGLRYDQTVPLARVSAQYWQKLTLPYRRYVIGPVFRNESTQAGRFRQFTQCDFDTVGSQSQLVDAEVPVMNYTALTKLGFPAKSFEIQINDRRLLNALASTLSINDTQTIEVFRAWDKLEKSDRKSIREELVTKGLSKDAIKQFDNLTDTLEVVSKFSSDQSLSMLVRNVKNDQVKKAVADLTELFLYISAMGVPSWAYKFNPLLARGLDYYTGPIFETIAGNSGSITGGGRFDKLIQTLGGPDLPASGSSFGLERVMGVMEELNLKSNYLPSADVYITVFDQTDSSLVKASFEAATAARLTGLKVEVYTGPQVKLSKQLDIASKKKASIVLIIGPDELRSGEVTVKSMFALTGEQKQYSVNVRSLGSVLTKLFNR